MPLRPGSRRLLLAASLAVLAAVAYMAGHHARASKAPHATRAACPTLDRVATYSTEELGRLYRARKRMEAVK
jgi:hypothetical protein